MVLSPAHEPVRFKNVWEFKDFARSQGLYLHSGRSTGCGWNDNYYVAEHPITLDDLGEIGWKGNCGLTPAWRGILWVAQVTNRSGEPVVFPDSIGGKWRIWGNIMVAGDEAFMDRMERLYQTN